MKLSLLSVALARPTNNYACHKILIKKEVSPGHTHHPNLPPNSLMVFLCLGISLTHNWTPYLGLSLN